MVDSFKLDDKTIIITGASSGIGRQCAITCSKMGAKVVLLGRNVERLSQTLKNLEIQENHLFFSVDLLDYDNVETTVNRIKNEVGQIDGMINCAGISTTLPFQMSKPEKMDVFFHANVHSAINLTRLITKPANLRNEGASVIFMSSIMGVVGENAKSLYSMTKGALIAATRSLAIELANRNIRVNCISPGVVDSPMSQNAVYSRNEEALSKVKALHPLGLGQPEDVANACVFLLSDASKWITGINLIIDGGYTAR